jgi:P27 family predicted phage terminase small subunit
MGRPRKANSLKLLEGAQPCRINNAEPASPKGAGDCPDHLDDVGRSAWLRLTRRLDEMGVLTLADGEAIALYASIYSRWTSARIQLDHDGLSITNTATTQTKYGTSVRELTKPHPLLAVLDQCEQKMARLLTQFGMTPSSRSSLHVQGKPEEDPILAFIARSKSKPGRRKKT